MTISRFKMLRACAAVLAAAAIMLSCAVFPSAGQSSLYRDIFTEDWYAQAVEYVTEQGYFCGMGEAVFCPDSTMSRAMLATVLWRAAGSSTAVADDPTDVPADAWYTQSVRWAVQENIMETDSDGCFSPDAAVMRGEAADALFRFAQYRNENTAAEGDLTAFCDAAALDQTRWKVFSWAVGYNIILGDEQGCLQNDAPITRAECAAMLLRYDRYLEQNISPAWHAGADGSALSFTFTDDTPGAANGVLHVYANVGGIYQIYWGCNSAILENSTPYRTVRPKTRTANDFPDNTNIGAQLAIPAGATQMIAVNQEGETVAYYDIPAERLPPVQSPLAVFGVLSDIHLRASDSTSNGTLQQRAAFTLSAMEDLARMGAQAIAVSGDLTGYGYQNEFDSYRRLLDRFASLHPTVPVYACTGNHDVSNNGAALLTGYPDGERGPWQAATADSAAYTGPYQRKNISPYLDYTVDIGDCTFILLNQLRWSYDATGEPVLTEEQFAWLEQRLEENKERTTFLFFHSFLKDTCGDATNGTACYGLSLDPQTRADALRLQTLLEQYPNTVPFSGHSHFVFDCDQLPDLKNYCYPNREVNVFRSDAGTFYVHVPSATCPRTIVGFDWSTTELDMTQGEGYLVEVYEDHILLRGLQLSDTGKILGAHWYRIPLPGAQTS